MSDKTSHTQGRYAQVKIQDFSGHIPEHILAKLPPEERYLIENVSTLEAKTEWLIAVVVVQSADMQDVDVRLTGLETATNPIDALAKDHALLKEKVDSLLEWKAFISGKWAIIGGLGLLVGSSIVKFIFDAAVRALKP